MGDWIALRSALGQGESVWKESVGEMSRSGGARVSRLVVGSVRSISRPAPANPVVAFLS